METELFLLGFCSAMLGSMVVLPSSCIFDRAEQPASIPIPTMAGFCQNTIHPAPPGMRNRPWGLGVACLHGIWSNPLESSLILRLPHPSAFIHETPGKSVRVMPAEWSNEAGFSFAEGFRS